MGQAHASAPHTSALRRQRLSTSEAMIAVAGCGLLVACALLSGGHDLGRVSTSTVTVKAGETLWSVAQSHPVRGLETAQAVELIADLNDLDADVIQAGQTLRVPSGDAADTVAMR